MRSSKFAVLSIISLILYAIVDFCKNALETVLQVRLIAEAGRQYEMTPSLVKRGFTCHT